LRGKGSRKGREGDVVQVSKKEEKKKNHPGPPLWAINLVERFRKKD